MWPESVASGGSQDISSCLFKHFCSAQSQAGHIIMFSDVCDGNINMACFWLYVVSNPDLSYTLVDHKFMLSWHSYLPNDRVFGAIIIYTELLRGAWLPSRLREKGGPHHFPHFPQPGN